MTKRILLIIGLLVPSLFAQTIPVVFNNTQAIIHGTGTTYSHAFTVTVGAPNPVAFAAMFWDDNCGNHTGLSLTAPTLGGSSMTAVGAALLNTNGSCHYWTQWFYLANPPTGSQTLATTATTNTYEIIGAITTYTGVNQTTPVRPGTYLTANTNVFGGLVSILVPTQVGDLVVSSGTNADNILSTNQTLDESVTTTGCPGCYFGHQTASSPQALFVWYGGSTTETSYQLAFSIQAATNSTVLSAIGGVPVGRLPGQLTILGGTHVGSAVSGYLTSIGGLSSPAGTVLVSSYFNASGGTNGSAPTTTTLGNSVTGDSQYNSWNIGGMGAGMTYTNAATPPALFNPVTDNSGATHSAADALGVLCTTGVSVHCGTFYNSVTDWNPSISMGYWIYSTCIGTGSQDCGSQAGLEDTGNNDGFGIHPESVVCSYNGFSADPGTNAVPQCLTGKYAQNTWYRFNMQRNVGQANFTATFSTTTPIITATQTLSANQAVVVSNSGGSLPTGLSAQTPYYVLPLGLSGSQFALSATQNGTPIQVSSAGSGTNTFKTIHQITICNAAGTFIGTIYLPTSTTAYANGRYSPGIGGEEPAVSGDIYYYYGFALDGTGKFSNTQCIL